MNSKISLRIIPTLMVLLLASVSGCKGTQQVDNGTTDKKSGVTANDPNVIPVPSPPVNAITLSSMPNAINLDDEPGPDGLQVRIQFWQLPTYVSLALKSGTVECLLFENRISGKVLNQTKPTITWKYSANTLGNNINQSQIGYMYTPLLQWDKSESPKSKIVTITVRLLRPGSEPLYAKPIYLSLVAR